jgi:NAD(P)-dependent dehydrogenase (short-subunit alcohol dehydrogenase family)
MLLTGTRALVTGATSGLGRAMARALADAGARVAVASRERTRAEATAAEIGPSGAAVEALARVIAADLLDTPVRASILLPGGATSSGMIPDDLPAQARAQLLDPSVMGPPIGWLASEQGARVHDERIVATKFQDWLSNYRADSRGAD